MSGAIAQLIGISRTTDSVCLQRTLVKVALFGGAAALCAYAGYRVYNSLNSGKGQEKHDDDEEEEEYVLAPEYPIKDDDDSDDSDDDDAYETASEELGEDDE